MPPIVSVQAQPASPGAVAADCQTWVLPPVAASVRSARRQVGGRLREWGLQHLVEDAELIVSELLTNAVCHGSPRDPIWHTVRRIRASTGDVIRLEVGDHGQGWGDVPAPREAGDDVHCDGRGLCLVAALSSGWGAWRLAHGHLVWAELPMGVSRDGSVRAEPSSARRGGEGM